MTTNQVICPECGNTMLASTASSTGGLCVPCASGTRKTLGSVKRRYDEFLERTKVRRAVWSDIVNLVHNSPLGLAALTPSQKTHYLTAGLDAEVWRGGIHTYFHNSSGSYYLETLAALDEIRAPVWREYLQKACKILFPNIDPPKDTDQRRALLPWWPEAESDAKPAWTLALEDLEAQYQPKLEKLSDLIESHAVASGIFSNETVTPNT